MTAVAYLPGWAAGPQAFETVHWELGGTVLDWAACLDGELGALGRFLDQAEGPVVLVGWSLGAQLALQAGLDRPERVRGLVLAAATPRFLADDEWPGQPAKRLRAMRSGLARDPEAVLADFWQRCAQGSNTDGPALRTQLGGKFSADRLAAGLDWLGRTDLRARLGELTAPVRLCHGREDAIVPAEAGERLAAALPEAASIALAGGHAAALEESASLLAAIRELADAG